MLFDQLHARARTNARVRFTGSRRLLLHHRLSQWSVTLASIALIAIPLLQAYGVPAIFTVAQLNAIQGFLAVLVLAYSLLLTQENFAVRSDRMHSCGIELNLLASHIEPYTAAGGGTGTLEQHAEFARRYHDILTRYENHAEVDYLSYKAKKREDSFATAGGAVIGHVRIVLHHAMAFFHYVLLIVILVALIWRVFDAAVQPIQPVRSPDSGRVSTDRQ